MARTLVSRLLVPVAATAMLYGCAGGTEANSPDENPDKPDVAMHYDTSNTPDTSYSNDTSGTLDTKVNDTSKPDVSIDTHVPDTSKDTYQQDTPDNGPDTPDYGIDTDKDGSTDVEVDQVFCVDNDLDGRAPLGAPNAMCDHPGQVDCDDGNPNVYEGAVEIPGDGIDNDCDPTTNDNYKISFVGVSTLDNSVLESLTVRLFSAAVAKEDLNTTEPLTICEPASADSVVTDCEVPQLGVYQFQIYAKDGSTSMRIGLVDVVENFQPFELQVMEEHALTPTQQIEYNNSFLEYFKRRSHTTDTYTVEFEDGTTETFKNETPIVATYEKLMNGQPLSVYVPDHVSNDINVADAVRAGLDAVYNKVQEVLPDFELFQYVSSAEEADVVVDMVSQGNSQTKNNFGYSGNDMPILLPGSTLYIGNGIAFGLEGEEKKSLISAVAAHELDHVVYDSGHSLADGDLMKGSPDSLTMNNCERDALVISTRLNERNMSNYQPVPEHYK